MKIYHIVISRNLHDDVMYPHSFTVENHATGVQGMLELAHETRELINEEVVELVKPWVTNNPYPTFADPLGIVGINRTEEEQAAVQLWRYNHAAEMSRLFAIEAERRSENLIKQLFYIDSLATSGDVPMTFKVVSTELEA